MYEMRYLDKCRPALKDRIEHYRSLAERELPLFNPALPAPPINPHGRIINPGGKTPGHYNSLQADRRG